MGGATITPAAGALRSGNRTSIGGGSLRHFKNRNVAPNHGRIIREERVLGNRPAGDPPGSGGTTGGGEGPRGGGSRLREQGLRADAIGANDERAVLFGAVLAGDEPEYHEPLRELERLAETAGAVVAGKISQRRRAPHPSTLVGPGFVDAVGRAAEATEANLLIADNDLSPAQAFNIQKRTQRPVIDRSQLILDIFASHARSRESQVAVELAQLEYALPRLKKLWSHLERQRGGIGLRGPGETQLETDRRLVKRRIAELKRTLQAVQARKRREIQARKGEFTVALVGYTNSGKSTLMNALSGRKQKVADQLFATLDTKTAVVLVAKNRRVLLSDTVGFIQKIPHHLIASFHATLEEVMTADLLLHVVDISHPDPRSQVEAVDEVLRRVGADALPKVMVLNKVDALPDRIELSYLRRLFPTHVVVSALTGEGLGALRDAVAQEMRRFLHERELSVPVTDGKARAFLHEHAEVLEERYEEARGTWFFRVVISDRELSRFHRLRAAP